MADLKEGTQIKYLDDHVIVTTTLRFDYLQKPTRYAIGRKDEVTRMIAEWEHSDDLPSDLAAKIIDYVDYFKDVAVR